YLTQQVPSWRDAIDPIESLRPAWLSDVVNKLARQIMVNINSAAAANAINLCATALLASRQRALTREQLIEQLECYLLLLQSSLYSNKVTLPELPAAELLEHALRMDKFTIEQDSIGDIVLLPREQAVLLTYYRNNIQHLFVLPSLIACVVLSHAPVSRTEVLAYVESLYPLLREELFLPYHDSELPDVVDQLLDDLTAQALLIRQEEQIQLNPLRLYPLQLLAASIKETLQRYAITFSLLTANPAISRGALEAESRIIAQRLSVLNGINAPEFFDKAVFSTLVNTLRNAGHIRSNGEEVSVHTRLLYMQLRSLLSPEVQLTIGSAALVKK
ncbi:MAG: glycerol-3-phosphate 1-O-acyltransferase PlsB, partial [Enterobacteriaceae bacterium]